MKNNDSGPKADGINFAEIRSGFLGRTGGGEPDLPKPKRKRGFHRALKAGKTWAIVEQGFRNMMNESVKALYNAIADTNCQAGQMWGLNAQLFNEGSKPESKGEK